MAQGNRVLVTGAGGFIGHHLTNRLVADGYWVRGVDIKYPEYESTRAQSFDIPAIELVHGAERHAIGILRLAGMDLQHGNHVLPHLVPEAFLGLVLGVKLVRVSIRRERTGYEANQAGCVACARCYKSCPKERVQRKANQAFVGAAL